MPGRGTTEEPRHGLRESRREVYLGAAPVVQRKSRQHRPGSFRKLTRGPMKRSATGRSSSLIIQGIDSSVHALENNSGLAGSAKNGTDTVPRLALAARGAMLVNAGREAGKFATCWRSAERTSLVVEAWVGSFAGLRAGPRSLAYSLGRTRSGRPETGGSLLQGALYSARSPRLSSMYHKRGDQHRRPLPFHFCSGCRWRGKRTHSVEMPYEQRQGR